MQIDDLFSWEWAASAFGPIVLRPKSGFETPVGLLQELPPFVANDLWLAPQSNDVYGVPATAADSTITLPEAASLVAPPSDAFFALGPIFIVFADGVKNAHKVQYRTPTKLLTPPLFGSKRHVLRLAAGAMRGEQPAWFGMTAADFDFRDIAPSDFPPFPP